MSKHQDTPAAKTLGTCPAPKQSSFWFWPRKRCSLQVVSRNHDQTRKKTTWVYIAPTLPLCFFGFADVCVPWFTLQGHQGGSQRTEGVKGFSTRPLSAALLSLPPAQPNKRPKAIQLMNDLVSEAQRQSFGPESFFLVVFLHETWRWLYLQHSATRGSFGVWIRAELKRTYQIFSKLSLPPFPHTCGQRCR